MTIYKQKAEALTLLKPKRLEIASYEADLKPFKDEVLVQVERVSLCGSDYKLFNGTYGGPSVYPIRFGHEWSGKAIAVGPQVNRIKIGDRVTGDCSNWCGNCPACFRDRNLCQDITKYGITKDGFSQQLKIVPAKYLYVANTSLSYSVIALSEPFAVALHAIHRLNDDTIAHSHGKTLIIGCGSLGIALYMLLKYRYCWEKNLEIYDVLPERLFFLQKIFPNEKIGHSLKPKKDSKKEMTYKDLYSTSNYNLIFEATGKSNALQMAINLIEPRGTIVTLGMFSSNILDFRKIVLKALLVIGSIGGTGEFPEVLSFFKKNQDVISPLITAEYSYKQADKAFMIGQNRKQNIKVQIIFSNEKTKDI